MSTSSPPALYLRMWFLYPLLFPFYLMGKTPVAGKVNLESGVPQIADYWLVGLMALVYFRLRVRLVRTTVPIVCALYAFAVYTLFVNLGWAANLDDVSLLKSSYFYGYDAMLFTTVLLLYSAYRERFLEVTVHAVAASIVLQAILSPLALLGDSSARQPMFFNDENQLGYFCLLAAIVFVRGAGRFAIPLRYRLLVCASIGYLTLLSQCRGALSGLAVLAVVSLLGRPIRLLLVLGALAAVYLILTLDPALVSQFGERFVTHGEYDSLSTRGYDRIVNHPEHILAGSGEGAYKRFRSDLFGTEIHSSYGTLLFCYGIPGVVLFSAVLLLIARRDWKAALYLLPPFVYGSAHHGIRFAFFWMTLGFLCCMALERAPAADAALPPVPGPLPPDRPADVQPELAL
jgi:hypothetical protein